MELRSRKKRSGTLKLLRSTKKKSKGGKTRIGKSSKGRQQMSSKMEGLLEGSETCVGKKVYKLLIFLHLLEEKQSAAVVQTAQTLSPTSAHRCQNSVNLKRTSANQYILSHKTQ